MIASSLTWLSDSPPVPEGRASLGRIGLLSLTCAVSGALLVLLLAALLPGTLPVAAAAAAPQDTILFPITVTTTSDDNVVNGNCTLREAIIAANTDSAVDNCAAGQGVDTILLSSGVYSLTIKGEDEDAALTGDLDITASVVISGRGMGATVISATLLNDRIFDVDPGQLGNVAASIRGVTMYDGSAPSAGCVQNSGSLTLEACLVTECSALSGAGIVNQGALTLTHSSVTHNLVGSTLGSGGGVLNAGTMVMEESVVSDNSARFSGGMGNSGTLIVKYSRISHNGADYYGGVSNSGNMTILTSTIEGNQATTIGGIANFAHMTVTHSLIYSNTGVIGGGVSNEAGALVMTNTTVSGNHGARGAGILVLAGSVALYDSTVTDNVAEDRGEVSAAGNAGGIHRMDESTGTVRLYGTLLAGNLNLAPESSGVADCFGAEGTFVSGGHNLVGIADGCNWVAAAGDQAGSSAAPLDASLAPLADNGGPTLTHALLPGSVAIDAGGATCPATDQRGYYRWDGLCDVGAYEYGARSFIPVAFSYLPFVAK